MASGGSGGGNNGRGQTPTTTNLNDEEAPLLPVYRQYSSSEIFDAKHGPMVPSWGAVVDDAKTILSLGSAVFVGEQPLNFLKGASFLQTALSTP